MEQPPASNILLTCCVSNSEPSGKPNIRKMRPAPSYKFRANCWQGKVSPRRLLHVNFTSWKFAPNAPPCGEFQDIPHSADIFADENRCAKCMYQIKLLQRTSHLKASYLHSLYRAKLCLSESQLEVGLTPEIGIKVFHQHFLKNTFVMQVPSTIVAITSTFSAIQCYHLQLCHHHIQQKWWMRRCPPHLLLTRTNKKDRSLFGWSGQAVAGQEAVGRYRVWTSSPICCLARLLLKRPFSQSHGHPWSGMDPVFVLGKVISTSTSGAQFNNASTWWSLWLRLALEPTWHWSPDLSAEYTWAGILPGGVFPSSPVLLPILADSLPS